MTGVIALAGAIAVPLAAAGPASADQVRQRQQWVLSALNVSAAWHLTQGKGVTVAVIDSGVDPSVSDLAGSVRSGPDLTGVHTSRSNPNWGAHGTWMASLIAGHGHGRGNQDGIIGVAPKARILSIRVITDRSDPGYSKYQSEPGWRGQHELAKAITYAVRHGAGVINMSLGYNGASNAVRSALQGALAHNVVVVASSGNAGASHAAHNGKAPYSFPADYPGVIGVAAVTASGTPAYFSSENLSVQVAAPGVSVPAEGRGSKYWVVSGTSPASALTAGVAALIKSKFPKLSASQIRGAITGSTANRPGGGYDDRVGFGTVDASAALKLAGRLAKQVPAFKTRAGKAAGSGLFGRGESGVPAFPVAARGRQKLLTYGGVAAGAVILLIVALCLVISARRRKRRAAKRRGPIGVTATQGPARTAASVGQIGQVPPGHPIAAPAPMTSPGPVTPAAASGADLGVRYPTQIYPAQPSGLPVQGYISQPAEGMAGTAPAPFGQQGQAPQVPGAAAAAFGQQGQTPGMPGTAPAPFGQQGYPWPGQPGQGLSDPSLAGSAYAGPSQPPPGFAAPGTAGPGYGAPGAPSGAASAAFPAPPYQGGAGAGPGYASPAGSSAPAGFPTIENGVGGAAPAIPGAAGQADADSEWPFDDGASTPAVGPAAATTGTPAAAEQSASPGQPAPPPQITRPNQPAAPGLGDAQAGSDARLVARPGRSILPPPETVDDPLTSPRFSRDGRSERALRKGGYRPDWLPSRHSSKRAPSPGGSGPPGKPGQAAPAVQPAAAAPPVEPAQPAPAASGQLASRTHQQVQAQQA
ncbi:MAG: S8 family serine peptidase, partial [Nocardiopsaceae bacterium]|nr:S8 family serine peptidase [Nocardiopsaceae bacterium]